MLDPIVDKLKSTNTKYVLEYAGMIMDRSSGDPNSSTL